MAYDFLLNITEEGTLYGRAAAPNRLAQKAGLAGGAVRVPQALRQ